MSNVRHFQLDTGCNLRHFSRLKLKSISSSRKQYFFNVLKKHEKSPRSIKLDNFIRHKHLALLQIIDSQKREDFSIKCLETWNLNACAFFIAGKGHLVYQRSVIKSPSPWMISDEPKIIRYPSLSDPLRSAYIIPFLLSAIRSAPIKWIFLVFTIRSAPIKKNCSVSATRSAPIK